MCQPTRGAAGTHRCRRPRLRCHPATPVGPQGRSHHNGCERDGVSTAGSGVDTRCGGLRSTESTLSERDDSCRPITWSWEVNDSDIPLSRVATSGVCVGGARSPDATGNEWVLDPCSASEISISAAAANRASSPSEWKLTAMSLTISLLEESKTLNMRASAS